MLQWPLHAWLEQRCSLNVSQARHYAVHVLLQTAVLPRASAAGGILRAAVTAPLTVSVATPQVTQAPAASTCSFTLSQTQLKRDYIFYVGLAYISIINIIYLFICLVDFAICLKTYFCALLPSSILYFVNVVIWPKFSVQGSCSWCRHKWSVPLCPIDCTWAVLDSAGCHVICWNALVMHSLLRIS